MRVLLVTDVFPNNVFPNFGTFTQERLRALKRSAEVKVVAPVPYFPTGRIFSCFGLWHKYSQILRKDVVEGVSAFDLLQTVENTADKDRRLRYKDSCQVQPF